MMYLEHNFTENFCNAVGHQDEFQFQELLLNELARLSVQQKKEIVGILRSENVNVTVNDPPELIAKHASEEVAKGNEKIAARISELIVKNRFDKKWYDDFIGAIGKKSKTEGPKKESAFWKKLGEQIKNEKVQESAAGLLALGLKKAFDKDKKQDTVKNQANLDQLVKGQKAKEKEKVNVKKIIVIGLVIAGLGFITYKLIKSRNQ